jgi:PAS domain S-box-containing protein
MADSKLYDDCGRRIEELESELSRLKHIEAALRESEEKHRMVVENSHDAIFIVQEGQVKFPNERGREIGRQLGIKLESFPFINYVHPDDRELVIDRHKRRLKGEKLPHSYCFRLSGSGERLMWVEINAVVIEWEGRPATLNFLRDITARKQLETQLFQAQKMEAIGTLAGGLAHDFNNLLTCIQGNASAMMMDAGPSHPHFEMLQNISQAVESGAQLTRQLLGFVREEERQFAPLCLNDLIEQNAALFVRSYRNVRIQRELREGLWAVETGEGRMKQVLVNLCMNACQAMPQGGTLRIATRNLTLSDRRAEAVGIAAGRYVRVSVTDTGCGMDENTRQRVFDPFFSTKEREQGTGLGLTSVYGIAASHGGTVTVTSRVGVGTRFEVYLPASEKPAPAPNCRQLTFERMNRNETVLVVDDDNRVLSAVSRMLKRLGFRVLVALSAGKAVELFGENRDRVDLVLLDMIMPELSGAEAFNSIREIAPDMKFLFTSGCRPNDHLCRILQESGVGFLNKPFNERALYEQIRGLLPA